MRKNCVLTLILCERKPNQPLILIFDLLESAFCVNFDVYQLFLANSGRQGVCKKGEALICLDRASLT